MRRLFFSLFFFFSLISFGQVDIKSPSGLYEIGGINKKVFDITWESYFGYDTITNTVDVNESQYKIFLSSDLIGTIIPRLNRSEVIVNIIYPDYTLKTLRYPITWFKDNGVDLVYTDKQNLLAFFKKKYPVIVVTVPFYYKGKEYILHMRPYFE